MPNFRLTPALSTHRGMRRKSNEDAIIYHYPQDALVLQQYGALFAVADGVGGLGGGDRASATAVEKLVELYYQSDLALPVEARLAKTIQAVNQIVYELPGEAATTLVVGVILDEHLIIGSVGDSPAFRIRGGQVDKLVEEDVVQDPEASKKSRLTRAIGHKAEIDVETLSGTLAPGDRILLCSDGLTRYLDTQKLRHLALLEDPRTAVTRMIQDANDAGGADNISVALIRVDDVVNDEALSTHIKRLNAYVSVEVDLPIYAPVNTKPATRFPETSQPATSPAATTPSIKAVSLDDDDDDHQPLNTKPGVRFPDAPMVGERIPSVRAGYTPPSFQTSEQAATTKRPQSNNTRLALFMIVGAMLIAALLIVVVLLPSLSANANPTITPNPATPPPQTEPAAVETQEIPTVLPQSLEVDVQLRVANPVIAYLRLDSSVAAFTTAVDRTYTIQDIETDAQGRLWYRLLDTISDQVGWVIETDLTEYRIVGSN